MLTPEKTSQMQESTKFHVSRAHLEMAYAFLGSNISRAPGSDVADVPQSLLYALSATNYQNAYLAVSTFLAGQFSDCFGRDKDFRTKFKSASIDDVLKKEVPNVKDLIKHTCLGLNIEHPCNGDARLYGEFNQVVSRCRNFFVHPKPEQFHEIISEVVEQTQWGMPADIARRMIIYFYDKTNTDVPEWLTPGNHVFKIADIMLLGIEK